MGAESHRLGTRGSALALWQAEYVAGRLRSLGVDVEIVYVATRGDQDQIAPIANLGEVGAFTKEIQRALLDGRVDLAVHSLKDLPTEATAGLRLAAVPVRGAAGDVLISVDGLALAELPEGARVGTGSLRRRAHLWHERPDLRMVEARGNVETRVAKLREGQYDALVLAEAGIERLGLARIGLEAGMVWRIRREVMLPAVGQGALGVECRESDEATFEKLVLLEDAETRAAVTAERSLLAALTAGCLVPVGAAGVVSGGVLTLEASVLSADGREKLVGEGGVGEAEVVGRRVAGELLLRGAGRLIAEARGGLP